MKSTDLMIGDWIYDIILESNTKVDKLKYEEIEGDCNVEFHDEDTFKPIPLTPEILEKNGLTNHRFSDSDFVEYEEWYSDDRTLRVVKDERDMFARVEDEQLEYMKAGGIVEFVHELQHLLKHAKIEKEIIL